jgi:hypothetical protein
MYVRASQKSQFRRQTFAFRCKSGGRQPAVVRRTRVQKKSPRTSRRRFAGDKSGGCQPAVVPRTRVQKKSPRTSRQRFAQRKSAARQPAVNVVEDVAPRLRRSPLMHGRQSHRHWRERPCTCVAVSHGGLTPPAPGAHAFVHGKSRTPLPVRCREPRGLTPPAPVHVRSCIAKVALPCRCGSVNHGGLTPPAPGAHAFVHRKEQDLLAWCATSEYALGARPSRIRCRSRSGCLQLASGLLREVAVTSVAVQRSSWGSFGPRLSSCGKLPLPRWRCSLRAGRL